MKITTIPGPALAGAVLALGSGTLLPGDVYTFVTGGTEGTAPVNIAYAPDAPRPNRAGRRKAAALQRRVARKGRGRWVLHGAWRGHDG